MSIIATAICEYNRSDVFHLQSTGNLSLINAMAMLDDTRKTYDYLATPIVQLQSRAANPLLKVQFWPLIS